MNVTERFSSGTVVRLLTPEEIASRRDTGIVVWFDLCGRGVIRSLTDGRDYQFASYFLLEQHVLGNWEPCRSEATFGVFVNEHGVLEAFCVIPKGFEDQIALPIYFDTLDFFQACSRELTTWFQRGDLDLSVIHPGAFEELVAGLFEQEGYEVQPLHRWNQADGGVDLLAVKRVSAGVACKLAIQCKRHAKRRSVSLEPIRALNGVLDRFQAHAGVLVTTGYFSNQAKEEVRRHYWRISLQDYEDIKKKLRELNLALIDA